MWIKHPHFAGYGYIEMNRQLELLLELQTIEVKINNCENEKKKIPQRKQLTEVVSEVNALQEKYGKAGEMVEKSIEKCNTAAEEYDIITKKIEELQAKLADINEETDISYIDRLIQNVGNLKYKAERRNDELLKIKQQMDKASKLALEIGKTINSKKEIYDIIKPEYDKCIAQISDKIEQSRIGIREIEKQIDEVLLKRYRNAYAKTNRPPLVEFSGNTCRGCNMELSNIVKKKAMAEVFVECENCGCLLYVI